METMSKKQVCSLITDNCTFSKFPLCLGLYWYQSHFYCHKILIFSVPQFFFFFFNKVIVLFLPPVFQCKNFAVVYLVDITEVSDFNKMYELYDPCTVMFFYRNKHIMIDLGTGNNNKINWALEDSREMVDIVETVYRGARKGRGLVVSPKDYSTKYRY